MYVVTPRCMYALLLLLLLCCSDERIYTCPCSMTHRRLTTAGFEVAPHYHQLLVMCVIYEHRRGTCDNALSFVLGAVSNDTGLIPDLQDADPVCIRLHNPGKI